MPKTESNTRPTNRKVKQELERKKQLKALLNRRLKKITDSDLTSREKLERKDRLIEEYSDMINSNTDIEIEEMDRRIDRKVSKEMSDEGSMFGRPSNSTNRTARERLKGRNSADTLGKGSDEPITKTNRNKGGLIKTGAKDYRKGGMFY